MKTITIVITKENKNALRILDYLANRKKEIKAKLELRVASTIERLKAEGKLWNQII